MRRAQSKSYLFHYLQHKLAPGEYRAPRKMIEFSRKHQEDKLVKEQEDGLKQLNEDEVDLEVGGSVHYGQNITAQHLIV